MIFVSTSASAIRLVMPERILDFGAGNAGIFVRSNLLGELPTLAFTLNVYAGGSAEFPGFKGSILDITFLDEASSPLELHSGDWTLHIEEGAISWWFDVNCILAGNFVHTFTISE